MIDLSHPSLIHYYFSIIIYPLLNCNYELNFEGLADELLQRIEGFMLLAVAELLPPQPPQLRGAHV